MEEYITPSNIVFVLGLLSMIFGVYSYFRNPQIALDKQQDIDRVEVDSKAELLAKQVQWEKESTEKRFSDIGTRMDKALELAQNHTHTVDVKVDNLTLQVGTLTNKITELSTIINERMPRRSDL